MGQTKPNFNLSTSLVCSFVKPKEAPPPAPEEATNVALAFPPYALPQYRGAFKPKEAPRPAGKDSNTLGYPCSAVPGKKS